MVVVIDYGMGNVRSVERALERLGCVARISGERAEVEAADALVLPGVGAFGQAVENLERRGLREILQEQVVTKKKPILGICLGMQLFADSSEEMGEHAGFGWITGRVVRIDTAKSGLSLPHVGWNTLHLSSDASLFGQLDPTAHFYFDHTFHYVCDAANVTATVDYGTPITAAVERDHIFGVQFHPEKSQRSGLKLLRNFLNAVEGGQ